MERDPLDLWGLGTTPCPDGNGNTVFITVRVVDTNQADGGSSWIVSNGFDNPESCSCPLVQALDTSSPICDD